jgi:hypothetical protein
MDIVAHVERRQPDGGETQWIAQLQPTGPLVCKESTGKLGARRVLDLSRWFDVANGLDQAAAFAAQQAAVDANHAATLAHGGHE